VTRDYFAELYVAGRLADSGWNVYFPHRDRGMDFIISKTGEDGHEMIRPVQVKGKYPEAGTNRRCYGNVGKLNQTHPEMVLAIPFFGTGALGPALCVAYMPWSELRKHQRGYRCQPARFFHGAPEPRPDFLRYFDSAGLAGIERSEWGLSSRR
jgi:hypothetical protein